jgi:hypothetical protein
MERLSIYRQFHGQEQHQGQHHQAIDRHLADALQVIFEFVHVVLLIQENASIKPAKLMA